jgi:peptidyl-prolyl cis-trans isomerase SurA
MLTSKMRVSNILLIVFLSFFLNKDLYSNENSIIFKIENDILTNYDVKKEANYLLALNAELKNLEVNEIKKIALKSILNEKIKKIEIEKYFKLGENFDDPLLNNIVKGLYSRIGFTQEKDFIIYISQYNLTLEWIKEKLEIESLWNSLIYKKYKDQLFIDENLLKTELNQTLKAKSESKQYFLSEILINQQSDAEMKIKIKEILMSIKEVGFNNTANVYSSSSTANVGGKIGWVQENSLSTMIGDTLKNFKIGEITKPIKLSSGFIILKIEDKKNSEIKIDYKETLNNKIIYEKNKQLDMFSKSYFQRVKQNTKIDGQ